jgi:hypothetical protein
MTRTEVPPKGSNSVQNHENKTNTEFLFFSDSAEATRVRLRRDLMASPEKKIAHFWFPCGHKVAQQTGNRIDSTRVDEKINFDFRGDPLGRVGNVSETFNFRNISGPNLNC